MDADTPHQGVKIARRITGITRILPIRFRSAWWGTGLRMRRGQAWPRLMRNPVPHQADRNLIGNIRVIPVIRRAILTP